MADDCHMADRCQSVPGSHCPLFANLHCQTRASTYMLINMADAWRKLNQKIKEKRAKKGGHSSRKFQGDQLTIQRLSSEVSGKAQKYARVGP